MTNIEKHFLIKSSDLPFYPSCFPLAYYTLRNNETIWPLGCFQKWWLKIICCSPSALSEDVSVTVNQKKNRQLNINSTYGGHGLDHGEKYAWETTFSVQIRIMYLSEERIQIFTWNSTFFSHWLPDNVCSRVNRYPSLPVKAPLQHQLFLSNYY